MNTVAPDAQAYDDLLAATRRWTTHRDSMKYDDLLDGLSTFKPFTSPDANGTGPTATNTTNTANNAKRRASTGMRITIPTRGATTPSKSSGKKSAFRSPREVHFGARLPSPARPCKFFSSMRAPLRRTLAAADLNGILNTSDTADEPFPMSPPKSKIAGRRYVSSPLKKRYAQSATTSTALPPPTSPVVPTAPATATLTSTSSSCATESPTGLVSLVLEDNGGGDNASFGGMWQSSAPPYVVLEEESDDEAARMELDD